MTTNEIKVLVVDDSAFARLAISKKLKSSGGITVIDYAKNGLEALGKIQELKPDVVTLDVEMPEMDGLTTLERIMKECPTPVIMLSTLTGSGSEATIKALELGAVDFFLKQNLANPLGDDDGAETLKNKIILAARVKASNQRLMRPVPAPNPSGKAYLAGPPAARIVLIGCSTGGPRALYTLIPDLPADLPAAVVIVQHMPPGFTGALANRLDQLSNLRVKEAGPGDLLCEGTAYVARGGYHLLVEVGGILALNQVPPVCGVRPSVDVTLTSLARAFGDKILAVILTGMGSDGTNGARQVKAGGGQIIAEDQSTCIVWGMPRSVVEAGLADQVVPLPQVASTIVKTLRENTQGAQHDRTRVQLSQK